MIGMRSALPDHETALNQQVASPSTSSDQPRNQMLAMILSNLRAPPNCYHNHCETFLKHVHLSEYTIDSAVGDRVVSHLLVWGA